MQPHSKMDNLVILPEMNFRNWFCSCQNYSLYYGLYNYGAGLARHGFTAGVFQAPNMNSFIPDNDVGRQQLQQ